VATDGAKIETWREIGTGTGEQLMTTHDTKTETRTVAEQIMTTRDNTRHSTIFRERRRLRQGQ
jgi:hypothetical protein